MFEKGGCTRGVVTKTGDVQNGSCKNAGRTKGELYNGKTCKWGHSRFAIRSRKADYTIFRYMPLLLSYTNTVKTLDFMFLAFFVFIGLYVANKLNSLY